MHIWLAKALMRWLLNCKTRTEHRQLATMDIADIFKTENDLVEKIRFLKSELERTEAALAAYRRASLAVQPQPVLAQPPRAGVPSLDNLPIGEAIRVYLEWARSHGSDVVEAGEIFDAISAQKVMTARDGRFLRNLGSPWRSFTVSLGASPNFYIDAPPKTTVRRNTPVRLGRKK